jgi:predicted lipoprotein with Yx(FWY)xxD motif
VRRRSWSPTPDLGQILVDGEGRTLYLFKPDADGEPTCYDDCAAAWPPLLAEGEITVGEGLDDSDFSTATRTDGGEQVKVGDWPLYYFANDAAPGDTNGQGLNEVWYVVSPSGEAIED